MGIIIKNLIPARVVYKNTGKETSLSSIRFGFSYNTLDDMLGCCVDIKRVLKKGYKEEYYIGTEFRPLPIVSFRTGIGEISYDKMGVLCIGAGIHVKGISVDYAFNGRSEVEWAGGHRVGISYRIKK
jgi:hypothetical protein